MFIYYVCIYFFIARFEIFSKETNPWNKFLLVQIDSSSAGKETPLICYKCMVENSGLGKLFCTAGYLTQTYISKERNDFIF